MPRIGPASRYPGGDGWTAAPSRLDRRSYRNGWRKWEAFATGHGATTLPANPEALAAFVEHLAAAGAIFNAVSTSYRLGPLPAAAFARTRASYRPATVVRPDPPPAGVSTTSPSASIWRAHSSIFTRSRQYSSKCWRSRRVNCGQSRSHLLPPTSTCDVTSEHRADSGDEAPGRSGSSDIPALGGHGRWVEMDAVMAPDLAYTGAASLKPVSRTGVGNGGPIAGFETAWQACTCAGRCAGPVR